MKPFNMSALLNLSAMIIGVITLALLGLNLIGILTMSYWLIFSPVFSFWVLSILSLTMVFIVDMKTSEVSHPMINIKMSKEENE